MKKMGRSPLLTPDEEDKLVDFCVVLQRSANPLSPLQLQHEVGTLLEEAKDERMSRIPKGYPSKFTKKKSEKVCTVAARVHPGVIPSSTLVRS